MLESILGKKGFQPAAPPRPKAFPLGGRWAGEAGSDEGATLYPTFPCRSRKGGPECRPNGIFLLLRWATRSPPHQSPPVTASPQGEAFVGGMPLQQNAFAPTPCSRKMRIQIRACRWAPKQPHHRNNAPQPPKPASANERAIKPGVQGACPRPSFSPFLGRNGDPRRAGGATGRCAPRWLRSHPPEGYAPWPLGPQNFP